MPDDKHDICRMCGKPAIPQAGLCSEDLAALVKAHGGVDPSIFVNSNNGDDGSWGMLQVLRQYVGKHIRVSVGRELKIGKLEKVEYGYAHIHIKSEKPGGPGSLAVVKVSRIASCELWG